MSRTDIFHLFNKNQTSAAIATALQKLLAYKKDGEKGRREGETCRGVGGHIAERWAGVSTLNT